MITTVENSAFVTVLSTTAKQTVIAIVFFHNRQYKIDLKVVFTIIESRGFTIVKSVRMERTVFTAAISVTFFEKIIFTITLATVNKHVL